MMIFEIIGGVTSMILGIFTLGWIVEHFGNWVFNPSPAAYHREELKFWFSYTDLKSAHPRSVLTDTIAKIELRLNRLEEPAPIFIDLARVNKKKVRL